MQGSKIDFALTYVSRDIGRYYVSWKPKLQRLRLRGEFTRCGWIKQHGNAGAARC